MGQRESFKGNFFFKLTEWKWKYKRKETITNRRKETGNMTTSPGGIGRIIEKHCEQLYAHKFGNLDKMDKFSEVDTTTTYSIWNT